MSVLILYYLNSHHTLRELCYTHTCSLCPENTPLLYGSFRDTYVLSNYSKERYSEVVSKHLQSTQGKN